MTAQPRQSMPTPPPAPSAIHALKTTQTILEELSEELRGSKPIRSVDDYRNLIKKSITKRNEILHTIRVIDFKQRITHGAIISLAYRCLWRCSGGNEHADKARQEAQKALQLIRIVLNILASDKTSTNPKLFTEDHFEGVVFGSCVVRNLLPCLPSNKYGSYVQYVQERLHQIRPKKSVREKHLDEEAIFCLEMAELYALINDEGKKRQYAKAATVASFKHARKQTNPETQKIWIEKARSIANRFGINILQVE